MPSTPASSRRSGPAATSSSAPPSACPTRPASASPPPTPSHTGRSDGYRPVPADVHGGGARAPPGAEPGHGARRGDARRPRDRRRDLPDRALAEGHERDDGLRGHG